LVERVPPKLGSIASRVMPMTWKR